MAVTFLEPGGDATGNVDITTTQGLWRTIVGVPAPACATDFVHGEHTYSIKYNANDLCYVRTQNGASMLTDSGSRVSVWLYFNAMPNATATILYLSGATGNVVKLRVTSAGALQLFENAVQIGTTGATLSTGVWYRISLAYVITSTTVNRFELFVDGTPSISVTNATLSFIGTDYLTIGNAGANATLDMRSSDLYMDTSASLTDTGEVWVTSKRPVQNGSANEFVTQIGSGGSGYGTGHSSQVNEIPVSATNGWSVTVTGTPATEEYSVETLSSGYTDISSAQIIDYMGWTITNSGVEEAASMVLGNTTVGVTLPSYIYTSVKMRNSTVFPTGLTDIGIITATTSTLVRLYDCGIIVAYIPGSNSAPIGKTTKLNQSIHRASSY